MKAQITSYRRGRHSQTDNQMIILPDGEAKDLVGKTVVWKSSGKDKKEIKGKITALHGKKGYVRAHFEKGMPGQALGQKVEIV